MNRGFWAVFGAFVLWGLFPLYWHEFRQVPALLVISHRVVWCSLLVAGYLTVVQGRGWLMENLRRPRVPLLLATSSVLISSNWGLYIWSVAHGHVVDGSLGYFINPLVNVLLGVMVLRERLNRAQWVSVGFAAAGVAYLTWLGGAPPWIALGLAISFALYGLVRKLVAVEAIAGLAVECVFLLPAALVYLAYAEHVGIGAFGYLDAWRSVMLIAGGAITAVPLIWFAYGARRISYSLVGIIQYVGPTLQLLTGVLVFGEPFTASQMIGFALIWTALAVYGAEALWRGRRPRVLKSRRDLAASRQAWEPGNCQE